MTLPSKISVHSPKLYFATTSDGWRIALYRSRPLVLDESRAPVLLVTSPTYNASFWSVHDKVHFVRYLAKRGWDVWVVSLRGTGRSTRPGYLTLDQTLQQGTGFKYIGFDWTLDDCILRDLPAALKFIQQTTGQPKITCVGQGLGATVLLAYLAVDQEYLIDRAIAIAPPFKYFEPVPDIFYLAFPRQTSEQNAPPVNISEILFYNRENVDPQVVSDCTSFAMESIPPGMLQQFRDLLYEGELQSADKNRNYFNALKRIRRPVLLVCGKKDNLAPPEGVWEVYEQIGSKKKWIREFGRANMYRADYGHDDLIIGKWAKKEVYPYLENWLRENGEKKK